MYRLSVDVGGTKTVMALVDANGKLLTPFKQPTAKVVHEAPADALAQGIRAFCQERGVEWSSLEGIGIGVPGVMDRVTGVVASCPNLQILDGRPLAAELTERLGVPVLVDNDVNLIALGEHAQGRGQGVDDLACVYVGSGIGGGLILNGDLYGGTDGAAGEVGHMVVEPDGLPCTCGGLGCLEMYCSGKALALQAASLLGLPERESVSWSDAEQVITAARAGHPAATQAMYQIFRYLGIGLTNVVNLLNVRLVILGGGIVHAWPEGVAVAREVVRQRGRAVIRERLQIETALLGDTAGLVGAAVLVARALEGRAAN